VACAAPFACNFALLLGSHRRESSSFSSLLCGHSALPEKYCPSRQHPCRCQQTVPNGAGSRLEGGHQLLCQKRTRTSAVNPNASISYTHLFKYTVEAIAVDPYSRAG